MRLYHRRRYYFYNKTMRQFSHALLIKTIWYYIINRYTFVLQRKPRRISFIRIIGSALCILYPISFSVTIVVLLTASIALSKSKLLAWLKIIFRCLETTVDHCKSVCYQIYNWNKYYRVSTLRMCMCFSVFNGEIMVFRSGENLNGKLKYNGHLRTGEKRTISFSELHSSFISWQPSLLA